MRERLQVGGKLLVSLRDHGPLMLERPAMMAPTFAGDGEYQRIVHQVWEWKDERRYIVHIFISTREPDKSWVTRHFAGLYRATTPKEIASNAEQVGFKRVEILEPAATGFYQPIVTALR